MRQEAPGFRRETQTQAFAATFLGKWKDIEQLVPKHLTKLRPTVPVKALVGPLLRSESGLRPQKWCERL